MGAEPTTTVFICYAHKDADYLDEVTTHLKPLIQRQGGVIQSWSDREIRPGAEWLAEIEAKLEKASVAVLIVTPNFYASDFIQNKEVPALLSRVKEAGAQLLLVLARPSYFEHDEALSKFQALNNPQRTLEDMSQAERDRALVKLAQEIAARTKVRTAPDTPLERQTLRAEEFIAKRMSQTPCFDPKPAVYRDERIDVAALFAEAKKQPGYPGHLTKRFERCLLEGPAVVGLNGSVAIVFSATVSAPGFEKAGFFVAQHPEVMLGPFELRDCEFYECVFMGIGFAAVEEQISAIMDAFKDQDAEK